MPLVFIIDQIHKLFNESKKCFFFLLIIVTGVKLTKMKEAVDNLCTIHWFR